MFNFRISSPATIRRMIENSPDSIKEIILNVKDPDIFLSEVLVGLQDDQDWPYAVNPSLIVNPEDEDELKLRAKNIVEMTVEEDLFGLNLLDFGCGGGDVSVEMLARGARKVVGFDIKENPRWGSLAGQGNVLFTTDWKAVMEAAPYDFILVYDVLDHVVDKEPRDVLSDLSKLLTKDGRISVRFHPWISRHGTHLYPNINRAFAHLFWDDDKLKKHGYEGVPTRKVIHPMWTYKNWIQKAGLSIVKEDKIQEPVEDFFLKNDLLKSVIQKHFRNSPMEEYKDGHGDLGRVMSFHFCDFVLTR